MPDIPHPMPPVAAHRNQQLFSDHYLNSTLPARDDWRRLADKADATRQTVAALLAAYQPSANEAQTEHDLVRPILKALGHDFEVQPALKTPDGTKKPDYLFYRDPASLQAHKNKTLTDAVSRQGALAVGDAKYWDRPLDSTLPTKSADLFTNKNPSYQIAFYVQHTGVDWGILTNGRLWRLVHRDTAHKLDRFYEVDLPDVLASDDPAAFLYFFAFFHRSAFEPHPLGVAAILQASEDFARGVGATLKAQVYDALRHLAQGFLDYAPNGLTADHTPEMHRAIYNNALILLYRLLFVLYAEARELLPVRESAPYRDSYSLHAIKQSVARDLTTGRQLLPTSATLWPRLRELFRSIDLGNPPLKVATFNGGLFDPLRHPFLEQHTVGDARLQQALDMLARVDGQFVDYRDLSVRHLGTIYEGLLEYTLQPIPPESDWTVALLNDKGERKATGSYYTPDYIVKYIVEQTVGPMLAEAVRGAADDDAQVQAVLGVNVLDPAMGSGHFLVEATEFVARFLVDRALLPGADARGEADLLYWKRRVAQSCIYGVDLNPLAVELAKLSLWLTTVAKDRPLSFLDHHLRAGNALVGARLADLQFGGAPAKAKKAKRPEAEGQLSMMADSAFAQSMTLAVGSMWLIEENAAQTVADVKTQEALYAKLRAEFTAKYGRLADVVTATHFGLSLQAAFWKPFTDYAMGRSVAALPQFVAWLDTAQALSQERHFFHWELEFPEVFFDRFGRPLGDKAGFDAVIGNPPYVRQEKLAPFKPFLQADYATYSSVADLYLYFYEQGLKQLQQGGRMAFISSGTFARANFAKAFRTWLPSHAQLETVIDFGENQPFEGAEMVRPSIVVLKKQPQPEPFRALFLSEKIPASLADAVQEHGVECDAASLEQSEWTFQHSGSSQLFAKLLAAGRPLKEVVEGKIYYGIKTGLNEAFIIDTATRNRLIQASPASAEFIKPVLRGEDLRPWYLEDEGRWLIVLPSGWTAAKYGKGLSEEEAWQKFSAEYPAVTAYLLPFADAARIRTDKGQYWWELRACDYYSAFDKPKIFWPDICKLPRFSRDTFGKYVNDKGFMIAVDDAALLGILQSRVTWYAVSQLCVPLRLRAGLWQYQMKSQFVSRLPIPDTTDAEREAIGGLAMATTEQARARYALHQKVRHRIASDLGTPGGKLNNKLTAWWTLDFAALRAELGKVFKTDIPVKERDEWEEWFGGQKAKHEEYTAEIVRLETSLNARVYALFGLTPDEITVIEQSTKYRYGEV